MGALTLPGGRDRAEVFDDPLVLGIGEADRDQHEWLVADSLSSTPTSVRDVAGDLAGGDPVTRPSSPSMPMTSDRTPLAALVECVGRDSRRGWIGQGVKS